LTFPRTQSSGYFSGGLRYGGHEADVSVCPRCTPNTPHTPNTPNTPLHFGEGRSWGIWGILGTLDPPLLRPQELEQIPGSFGSRKSFEAGKSMSFWGCLVYPPFPRTQSSGSPGSCPPPTPGARANPGIFWLQMMSSGGQILGLQRPAKGCHFESFSPTLPPLPFLRILGPTLELGWLAGSRGLVGQIVGILGVSPTHFVPFSKHLGWVYLWEITVKHSNVKQSR